MIGIWWILLIVFVYKVISKLILGYFAITSGSSGGEKFWAVMIAIILLVISVTIILPLVFNGIFNHLGLEVYYTWQQLLPVSMLISLYFADFSQEK